MVNEYSEESLADIIYRLGEEPRARRIARAIVRGRPMDNTIQLAEAVSRTAGRSQGNSDPPGNEDLSGHSDGS